MSLYSFAIFLQSALCAIVPFQCICSQGSRRRANRSNIASSEAMNSLIKLTWGMFGCMCMSIIGSALLRNSVMPWKNCLRDGKTIGNMADCACEQRSRSCCSDNTGRLVRSLNSSLSPSSSILATARNISAISDVLRCGLKRMLRNCCLSVRPLFGRRAEIVILFVIVVMFLNIKSQSNRWGCRYLWYHISVHFWSISDQRCIC